MLINFGDLFEEFSELNEVTYAERRLPTHIYISRSFSLAFGSDAGKPGRYVRKVFDEVYTRDEADWKWEKYVVFETPGGRKQLELNIARSVGTVRKIRIQKVPTSGDLTKLEPVLELDRDQSNRFIDLIKALDSIPIEGDTTARVDDQVLRDVFNDPKALGKAYSRDPETFRSLIENDADARDVIALKHRREVVNTMTTWLTDDLAFDEAAQQAGGPERAWQELLEENPWILGVGLSGQLVTSWDKNKLEQTVVGQNIQSVGKRVDALLATNGLISSLVFAEIKHHRTKLLGTEYRSGAYRPSSELAGAVTQVQQTIHLAARELGDYVQTLADDGSLTGGGTYNVKPRSFLIVGSLEQLLGQAGGPINDQVKSFELFRRNLVEPEILTFDELLARAKWHVQLAEDEEND